MISLLLDEPMPGEEGEGPLCPKIHSSSMKIRSWSIIRSCSIAFDDPVINFCACDLQP